MPAQWLRGIAIWAIASTALMFALPGCFQCNESLRILEWSQGGLPTKGQTEFKEESMDAYVVFKPDGANLTIVQVSVTGYDHQVSHDDAVQITRRMFEARDWGEPALEGAVETFHRCATSQ